MLYRSTAALHSDASLFHNAFLSGTGSEHPFKVMLLTNLICDTTILNVSEYTLGSSDAQNSVLIFSVVSFTSTINLVGLHSLK
jgi:hypothetical protein